MFKRGERNKSMVKDGSLDSFNSMEGLNQVGEAPANEYADLIGALRQYRLARK